MIGRILAISILAAQSAGASAQTDAVQGNRNVRVVVDFNYITLATNHWASEGAFVDQGTIAHGTNEIFKGAVAKVTDSPEGQNGSFTWTFSKAYSSGGGGFGSSASSGSWKMTGGTGQYEGITGQGIVKGTLNTVTGHIHDEFVGTVVCPKC